MEGGRVSYLREIEVVAAGWLRRQMGGGGGGAGCSCMKERGRDRERGRVREVGNEREM